MGKGELAVLVQADVDVNCIGERIVTVREIDGSPVIATSQQCFRRMIRHSSVALEVGEDRIRSLSVTCQFLKRAERPGFAAMVDGDRFTADVSMVVG